jgi:hypothetical protein
MISKIRRLENSHIVLWLLKDTCWVLDFKIMGMIMILPTIAMAVYITLISRSDRKELIHNLAVVAWILANSTWMIGEFYLDDSTRAYAAAYFITGLVLVMYYYLSTLFYERRAKH